MKNNSELDFSESLTYSLDRLDRTPHSLKFIRPTGEPQMTHSWQLQEAKNKFSSLVESAQKDGPQVVTKHGKEAVVVLSAEDFRKLTRPRINLHQFLRKSPLAGINLDISRDRKPPRVVSLS